MYNETMGCILDNLNQFGNNTDEVCKKCYQLYVGLDEFYQTLSPDGIGVDTVCMDVVDLVRFTYYYKIYFGHKIIVPERHTQ